jgi:hypothetical protein
MNRHELTKAQKRELRRIADLAHDRELSAALADLEQQFRRWRAGEIGPHDLSDAIHAFHQGPSRKLWLRYSDGTAELAALFAAERGIVAEHEIDSDVLELLKPRLASKESSEALANSEVEGPRTAPQTQNT